MASHSAPRILAFKADAAIAKGQAVKIGSDNEHVAKCSADTDKAIGVAQSVASAAEDVIEVAIPGGGAKGLAQTTIAAGKLVGPHSDAGLKPVDTAGDRFIGMAMESAVAGDLFDMEVVVGQAYQSES